MDGLDTRAGEDGEGLSSSYRQRIARALLLPPCILPMGYRDFATMRSAGSADGGGGAEASYHERATVTGSAA